MAKQKAEKKRNLSDDLASLEESDDFIALGRDSLLLELVRLSPVLDVGGGTGWLASKLSAKGLKVVSIDADAGAVKHAKARGRKVIHADLMKYKPGKKFRTVLMADVLEHIQDDNAALSCANALLEKRGELIICVPYHNFLWSKCDEARGHFRRYSRKELAGKLEQNGFKVKRFIFSNAVSIPPLIFARAFGLRLPHERFSRSPLNGPLASYLLHFENRLPLPAGSGVICIAEKKR